jgi:hypothetical protein
MRKAVFILAISLVATTSANATYQLDMYSTLYSCPFAKVSKADDPYDLKPLLSTLEAELRTKSKANAECFAKLQQVQDSIYVIDELYLKRLTPDLQEKIALDIYNVQLEDLTASLQNPLLTPEDITNIKDSIQSIKDAILTERILGAQKVGVFKEDTNAFFRSALFNHANNILNAYNDMDPDCLNLIGASNIASSVLSVASIASGYSMFSGQDILGSVIKLVSNLVTFIKDFKTKTGIAEIVNQRNETVLACTYYAIKHKECSYQRAKVLSTQYEELPLLSSQENRIPEEVKDYQDFLFLLKNKDMFKSIFGAIAAMDVSFLSMSSLSSYISDKLFTERLPKKTEDFRNELSRFNPEVLTKCNETGTQNTTSSTQKLDVDQSKLSEINSDDIVDRWIKDVNELTVATAIAPYSTCIGRSANYPRTNFQMVCDCLSQIYSRETHVLVYEQNLNQSISFIDIKSTLATHPETLPTIEKAVNFFQKFSDSKNTDNNDLEAGQKAVIQSMVNIMSNLKNFVAVDKAENDTELSTYREKINKEGKKIFNQLAEGSMAQISNITSVIIRDRSEERLNNAFAVIENHFLKKDKEHNDLNDPKDKFIKYIDYLLNNDLRATALYDFAEFTGIGTGFKQAEYNTAVHAFAKGFKGDILNMLDTYMSKQKKKGDPATATMMCALFNDFLASLDNAGHPRAMALLKKCKEHFSTVHLVQSPLQKQNQTLVLEKATNFQDACFFDNYVREENARKIRFSYDIKQLDNKKTKQTK